MVELAHLPPFWVILVEDEKDGTSVKGKPSLWARKMLISLWVVVKVCLHPSYTLNTITYLASSNC